MAKSIQNKIEELLQAGKSKKEIWQTLQKTEEPRQLQFYLDIISLPRERRKYQLPNLVLAFVLFFMTAKKLIAAFAFGRFDLWLLLMLVVPAVNIYVLREILRFRKLGYQFLFVLSLLAFLQPENHYAQEMLMLTIIVALSGFLYLKLFPAKKSMAAIIE